MSESMQMWLEIGFNIGYLVTIWILVALMQARQRHLPSSMVRMARYFIWAFTLLALGDTAHVGFRVLAYALGGLKLEIHVLGFNLGLVGAGAFSTAFTVTLFYMLMIYIWSERFQRELGLFQWFLLAMGLLRLILMLFPQNEWNRVIAPLPWSWIRNAPLVIQGLGIASLILRDSIRVKDRPFQWIGWMILTSFAFYAPVILFVARAPAVGMLMIPKTLAYVAIALIAYRNFFLPGPAARPVQERPNS
jgi:hypothetical protein